MTPSAAPVLDRRPHSLVPLLATIAALVAAGLSQRAVRDRPSLSLVGFALAAVLICLARPAPARPPESMPSGPAIWPPMAFWGLLGAGTFACVAAAAFVHLHLHPRISHLTWLAGLLLYGGAAWRARLPGANDSRAGWIGGIAVVVLAALVFGWNLSSIPPEVHGDDAEVGLDALDLIRRFHLFQTGWFWLPRFHALPTAIGLKLFGVDLLGLRFPSFAFGVLSVLLLFVVARRLWGTRIAVIAALLLASQRYFIHLSRTGFHYVDTPFVSLLALWLLLRAWDEQRLGAAVLCGVTLGLGVQTYYASRLVPALVGLTAVAWLTAERGRRFWHRAATVGVVAVAMLGTVAPLGAHFVERPGDLWQRTADTSVFGAAARAHLAHGYATNDLGRILLIQARAAFSLFNATPDNSVQYGYREPLFDPYSGALFVLGAALVIGDARRRSHQVVLLWTLLPLIAGAVLTIDTPFYPRISGLVPFAVIAVALALGHVIDVVQGTVRTPWGRRLGLTLAALALAAIVATNLRSYFIEYAPNHRHSPAVEIGTWIRAHGADKTSYLVGGAPRFFVRHGAIRFLAWGFATRDIVDLDAALESKALDPGTSVFAVMPAAENQVTKLAAAMGGAEVERVADARGRLAFIGVVPRAERDP